MQWHIGMIEDDEQLRFVFVHTRKRSAKLLAIHFLLTELIKLSIQLFFEHCVWLLFVFF